MAETAETIHVPPEVYLEMERKADVKSEYIDGIILAMAGASRRHNQITFNLAGTIGVQLENRPCVAYVSNMRVKVRSTGIYTYPDLAATCDEPQFEDDNVDTLLNPSLIVEVLSDATEVFDRGEKFAHYRRLPSISEYLLISQDKMRIEHFLRQGEKWVMSEFHLEDDRAALPSIGCELLLGEVYSKVALDDAPQTRSDT